jgi:hypothetical protein
VSTGIIEEFPDYYSGDQTDQLKASAVSGSGRRSTGVVSFGEQLVNVTGLSAT